ncbi:autotransporter-associated beta strand repeat protein [Opitutaceae bacterium TAV1]|nr:autotransporter-associated beta strand repeat protein [Opitutaceae bacterium TAV1]
MKTRQLLLPLFLAASVCGLSAATYQWNSPTTSQWGNTGAWSPGGAAPGADDIIGTPLQSGAMQVNGNRSIYGIDFDSATGWTLRSGTGSNTLTIGAGGLVKSGTSTLIIRDENTASGHTLAITTDSITVNAGTLAFGSNSSSPLTSLNVTGTTTVASGAVVSFYISSTTLSGGLQNNGTIELNSGPADSSNVVTVAGVTGSSTGLIRVSTGTAVKTATLKLDLASGTATYGGNISNGGTNQTVALEKTGQGTQILSGATGFSGGTTVNQGTLLVANASGSGVGTGAVSVRNGGTFGGSGIVALAAGNAVTVESGGTLIGGDGASAISVLTIANDVILESGSTLRLALGAAGAHSSINRTGGTWSFASDQSVFFDNIEGT